MKLDQIVFVDIETVPASDFVIGSGAPSLFMKRHKREIEEGVNPEMLFDRIAGLEAEFGKIVCVSVGQLSGSSFYVKSFAGRDEKEILEALTKALEKSGSTCLCGHNLMEFDLPFAFRRYLINGLPVPEILNVGSKKPWEVPHIDTMKLWGSTQWNYKVSLELLAVSLGLPSPKTNITGGQIGDIFYKSGTDEEQASRLKDIAGYCSFDVVTTANVYCKLKGLQIITEEQIKFL